MRRPYLTRPEPRRVAPWLLGGGSLLAILSAQADDRDVWLFPVLLLSGVGIGAQGVDAIRTGELRGRFPSRLPINANRFEQPITFWSTVVLYLCIGLAGTVFGFIILVDWLIWLWR